MVTIRRADRDDAERIGEIFASSIRELAKDHYNEVQVASWSGGLSVEQIRSRIESGNTYVAEIDGAVVGFVELNLDTRELEMVYVDPRYARRGVGSAMVSFAEERARAAGVKTLHLRGSLNAVPFYEAMGYTVTERKIHCNAQGIEFECVIMEKRIA